MCSSHWKLQHFDVIRWHGRWQCSVLNIYTVQQLSNWADGHLFLLGIWANTIYVVYYMNTGIWISHFNTTNLAKVWQVLSRKDIICISAVWIKCYMSFEIQKVIVEMFLKRKTKNVTISKICISAIYSCALCGSYRL